MGPEPGRTYIGYVSKPVYRFHKDAGWNERRPAIPPVFLGHYEFQALGVDDVREPAGLHGMQGWDVLHPTFQLADLWYHRHDASVRRALLVDEDELAAVNPEFVRHEGGVVRRDVVCPMWIELEQGSHLVFWGRFLGVGEFEDGNSLRRVDDLHDCGTALPVRLPKDVVAWP